jgi:hypothetical protein
LQRARLLASCYRKDEAHDPEVYAAAIAAVLADGYELAVIDYVTDPRSGLPSTQKFLPNVAEVREACEARATTLRRLQQPPFKPKSQPSAAKPRKPGQLNYAEFLKWAEENQKPQRPIGAFEPGGYLGPKKL